MTRAPARPGPTTTAPAHDEPATHAMLLRAVEEVARLLQADGAMVYLVDGDQMRFAVDAGIRNPEAQQLIRDLSLPDRGRPVRPRRDHRRDARRRRLSA